MALSKLANDCIGEAKRPAKRARSTSRDGSSANAFKSPALRVEPSRIPPLTIKAGLSLAKSRRALATADTSPSTKAIAVGPVRWSASDSLVVPVTARRTKVFLKTLKSPPKAFRDLRSPAISVTVKPRYSVTTAASAVSILSRTSSTTAIFSGLGFSMVSSSR